MANKPSATTFAEVSSRFEPAQVEASVLSYWEEEDIFEKSLEQRKDAPLFTFYDGPPYATGKPHYGHILQSAIKDTVLRYKTMRGYQVPRRVGWDTHGLPVEVLVEKELGLKTKKDIEAYGIEKFNQKCREAVFRYIGEFTTTLKRVGRWADYEDGYATLDRDYMESEWWVFKQLWDKQLVYQGFRSTPYCIRCGTPLSNFEVSDGYRDRTDVAVYVKLPVSRKDTTWNNPEDNETYQKRNLNFLIWTTTPWTLPANVAVAYNPEIEYVIADLDGEHYFLAKNRVEPVLGDKAKIVKDWSPTDFRDVAYEALYSEVAQSIGVDLQRFGLVEGHHVTADEGTGLVHMAPAFGTEDFEVGKRNNLPVLRTIEPDGTFKKDVPQWAGLHLFKANEKIVADLKERELLFKQEQYTHSYPHCWRCDEPLIYYALDSWFVKVQDLKEKMLTANQDITWIPEHIKEGRFRKGVESAPDWAVSRNRFWSVPIPVWKCEACGEQICVGSIEELQQLSGASAEQVKDIHRPYVDELTWSCQKCSGKMQRVPEVLDVWFDSGSMPYSQWHYPFENKEFVESGFPADFIAESIEMTRAWFYVLHVLAVALKGKPAYKNVIGSGIIFGEDGNKLSKKLKNYPEIDPTIEKYGADTVRMFFLNSTLGEPYVFAESELTQLYRNFTMRLWNVYSFFIGYANVAGFKPATEIRNPKSEIRNILDRWILTRLKQLENEVITQTDAYRIDSAARSFGPFVDDLSNWYVRRSRARFQALAKDEERQEALSTLYGVLVKLGKLLAPFMPFITEAMHRNLTGEDSVHLASLDETGELSEEEKALLDQMARVREAVAVGLKQRAEAGIKVRQPLGSVRVSGLTLSFELQELVQAELNVKEVISEGEGDFSVALDTAMTPELKSEGLAREIIRHGQVLRRKAGYQLDDKIEVVFETQEAEVVTAFEEYADMILAALQAKLGEPGKSDMEAEVKINGKMARLAVRKT